MYLKNNKGVTLLALTITIIVMITLSTTIIYNTNRHIKIDKVDKLYQDIENINRRIDDYYLKNGDIPKLGGRYCDNQTLLTILSRNASSQNVILNKSESNYLNPNDDGDYYVIDLDTLGGLILNYGYGNNYKSIKQNSTNVSTNITDVYIINEVSHQVYYPAGIVSDNIMYYSYDIPDGTKISALPVPII